MTIDDLNTPCLLVDRLRLEENLSRMQRRANENHVSLRPHIKTHKSVAIARRQVALGARGITVAKPGEAEVFVAAGFDDVRVAYPVVGRKNHERLLALTGQARISFCIDTWKGAQQASDFYAESGRQAEVLLEVDTGHGRTGTPWDQRESIDLAGAVDGLPGLHLKGILTHAGQVYHGPLQDGELPEEALRSVANQERDRMLDLAIRMREAGIREAAPGGAFEISIGSTPTMTYFENKEQEGFAVTEVRPGNYVFYDAMQAGIGSARLTDCALTVLATVVSKHRDHSGGERLYLDAGKKTLTSDTGYGTSGYGILLYNAAAMRPLPHARITGLSEEHAWVYIPGGATLDVADRVRLVPNHACVAVNTQNTLYLVEGDKVLQEISIDARGCVQ